MATATFAFSSIEFSIFNNIYYKIIEDVARTVDLDPNALTILYKGIEQTKTDNQTNVSNRSTENRPDTVSRKRVTVRVNQEYDEDDIATTAIHREEHRPIFYDKVVDVVVTPVYIQMNAELEFTYTSPSKTELGRIRDMIRIHLSNTRNIGHHEVDYTMLIPTEVTTFIEDVYDLRNRLIPESLRDYFVTHSTNRIYPVTDMSNEENIRLGVSERQTRIIGRFNFSPTPDKAEQDTKENTNRFSFTYSFSVSIPRALSVRYPLMICNRMLPEKYWSHLEEQAKANYVKRNTQAPYIGYSMQNFSNFESNRQLENNYNVNLPIRVPICDEFITKQVHRGYGIVMSLLIEIDEEDNRSLFNLSDLNDYHLNTRVLEYIRDRGRERITTPYGSHLYMGLHQKGRHYDNSILEVDEDLEVKSKVELSLLTPVRVTLAICIDLTYLPESVIRDLISDKDTFLDFLKDHLESRSNFHDLIQDKDKADNYLMTVLHDFFDLRFGVDDVESVRRVFEMLAMYSPAYLDKFCRMLHNYRSRMLENIGLNGIELVNRSNQWTYVDPKKPNVPRGESKELTYVSNHFGVIKYPEI